MQELKDYLKDLKKRRILPEGGFPYSKEFTDEEDFRNALSTQMGLFSNKSQAELLIQLNYNNKKRLFNPRHGLFYFGRFKPDQPELFRKQLLKEFAYQFGEWGCIDMQIIIDTLHKVEEEPLPMYSKDILSCMINQCKRAMNSYFQLINRGFEIFTGEQYLEFLKDQKRILQNELSYTDGSGYSDEQNIADQCKSAIALCDREIIEFNFIKLGINSEALGLWINSLNLVNQEFKSKVNLSKVCYVEKDSIVFKVKDDYNYVGYRNLNKYFYGMADNINIYSFVTGDVRGPLPQHYRYSGRANEIREIKEKSKDLRKSKKIRDIFMSGRHYEINETEELAIYLKIVSSIDF